MVIVRSLSVSLCICCLPHNTCFCGDDHHLDVSVGSSHLSASCRPSVIITSIIGDLQRVCVLDGPSGVSGGATEQRMVRSVLHERKYPKLNKYVWHAVPLKEVVTPGRTNYIKVCVGFRAETLVQQWRTPAKDKLTATSFRSPPGYVLSVTDYIHTAAFSLWHHTRGGKREFWDNITVFQVESYINRESDKFLSFRHFLIVQTTNGDDLDEHGATCQVRTTHLISC